MKKLTLIALLALFTGASASAALIDFETDNSFSLGIEDFVYAGDEGGTLTSGNGVFHGFHYTNPWDFWGGFVVSNRTITAPNDIYHEFTSAPGTDQTIGPGGSYAIGYDIWDSAVGALITFEESRSVAGAWFTNNKWTAEYIEQYYGADDYYRLIVTAYDLAMQSTGSVIIDMTNKNNWSYSALNFENAYALGFKMESSDAWTPFYFSIDDISVQVPEPTLFASMIFGFLWLIRSRSRMRKM